MTPTEFAVEFSFMPEINNVCVCVWGGGGGGGGGGAFKLINIPKVC